MKALGIILAGGNNKGMHELTARRASAAMPVGGNYRCIDFALSNMSNSHIQTVAVLTQFNARSLNEHLSSSKWWDFGRKQGGLYIFTPMLTSESSDWFRGTADAMYQNLDFLKRRHEPYVIISNGDCVYKVDYNAILDYHIEKKADITVICKDMPANVDVSRYGVVKMNEDARIVEFEEKPLVASSNTISTGIYIIRRRQLIEMLERCAEEDTYWSNISTVESYYQTNMDFLKPEVRKYFFRDEPKICTKVDDLPPAKYNAGSDVRNSLVASGCIVNSKVENSILFKKAFVGKNCVIKNSIILNDVYIGDNTHIENCIVESRNTLRANTYYCGDKGIKVVREDNARYVM